MLTRGIVLCGAMGLHAARTFSLFLGTPESHTGKMGGRAMVLVLEINFAVWVMIACLAREALQLTM
jgi:hypothetical protein